MKTLTQSQLVAIIAGSPGVVMLGLQTLTDTKARKTGNPFGQIFKRTKLGAVVGADYQKSVEREAGRQGADASEFEAEKLPWGEWVKGLEGKVIQHKGELFLRTQSTPGQRAAIPAHLLGYFDATGKELAKESVAPFIKEAGESAKQQDEAGLDSTIWVRTYKLSSVEQVTINGEVYQLEGDKIQASASLANAVIAS